MEAKSEVVISYETVFDLLRREKNRTELQALPESFIPQVCDYLQAKKTLLHKGFDDQSPIDEKQKLILHIQNMKKLLKELYDRRESKILLLAQNKVRTGNILIDPKSMLAEEKRLFELLVDQLESTRRDVLGKMSTAAADKQLFEAVYHTSTPTVDSPQETPIQQPEPPKEVQQHPSFVTLRFLQDVPKFVGRDLQVYGPFSHEDVASLPPELATILVTKGRAEEINS